MKIIQTKLHQGMYGLGRTDLFKFLNVTSRPIYTIKIMESVCRGVGCPVRLQHSTYVATLDRLSKNQEEEEENEQH